MPIITGNDFDGVDVTADDQHFYTLPGTTLGGSIYAMRFSVYNDSSYTLLGTLISDQFGVLSSTGSERNTVTIGADSDVVTRETAVSLVGLEHTVINHGRINAGSDTGSLFASDDGVSLFGESMKLLNTGSITARGNAVFVGNGAAGTVHEIVNRGTLESRTGEAILGSTVADMHVSNDGTIIGDVLLSQGNDIFDAGMGTVDGSIFGGQGDDMVILHQANAAGLPYIDGGDGTDTLDLSEFGTAIWADLTYAGTTVWTRGGNDLIAGTWQEIADLWGFENLIGTEGIDHMGGDDADNRFVYAGNSLITGVETIVGRGGEDTVDFSSLGSAVWVNLDGDAAAWTQDTDDLVAGGPWRQFASLSGIENIEGTNGSDEFYGDDADNTYSYIATEFFGGGTDLVGGGGGSDTVDFSDFGAGVWVNLGFASFQAFTQDDANAWTESMGDWRAIGDFDSVENITGTAFDDELIGDDTANILDGGSDGLDRLTGGGGDDTFVFTLGETGNSAVITDFSTDDGEKIDLSGVAAITDFDDLVNNHLNTFDSPTTATIFVLAGGGFGAMSIDLIGYDPTEIGAGLAISADDFIF